MNYNRNPIRDKYQISIKSTKPFRGMKLKSVCMCNRFSTVHLYRPKGRILAGSCYQASLCPMAKACRRRHLHLFTSIIIINSCHSAHWSTVVQDPGSRMRNRRALVESAVPCCFKLSVVAAGATRKPKNPSAHSPTIPTIQAPTFPLKTPNHCHPSSI